MKKEILVRNGTKVELLARSIREGVASLDNIPGLIRQVIEEDMWRAHLDEKTGEVFQFDSFKAFTETYPPDGLGTNTATLIRLCADDPLVVDLIDDTIQFTGGDVHEITYAVKDEIGAHQQESKKYIATGASRQAGLRKLRKHADSDPKVNELRQAVLAGKMSINKALIQAGLRPERLTIIKDPEKAAEALKRSFTTEELKQLIRLLRQS
ncbi:MAG: hypothetical protein HYR94_11640 [Chloroflexi bacterium]|nr:hypothetical protein [Chloroflexota bacterium]